MKVKSQRKCVIPVVLASDNNYAPYLYVALLSMLANANKNTFYKIFILVPNAFAMDNTSRINQLQNLFQNCDITFIDMKNCFENVKLRIKHITYITYYRLLIPELFTNFDKCVYLDIDTVVNCDLQDMYNTDIENCYIAGVKTPNYHVNPERLEKFRTKLGLPDLKQYVNAGILLLNLKKLREDNVVPKFLELMGKNFPTQDQDIINVACYNHIKHLPFKFNISNFTFSNYSYEHLSKVYSDDELSDAQATRGIVHYSDKIKPWKNPNVPFADLWWNFARKSPYYEAILYNNILNLSSKESVFTTLHTKINKLADSLISGFYKHTKLLNNNTNKNIALLQVDTINTIRDVRLRLENQCQTL